MHGWYSDAECVLLTQVAREAGTPTALEIGTLFGKSTLCILGGLQDREGYHITCVDPFVTTDPDKEHPAVVFFREMSQRGDALSHITLHKCSSVDSIPVLNDDYGFVHIDGDHSALGALLDIFIAARRTTCIAIHDYMSCPDHEGVTIAIGYFLQHSDWKLTKTSEHLAILKGNKLFDPIVFTMGVP